MKKNLLSVLSVFAVAVLLYGCNQPDVDSSNSEPDVSDSEITVEGIAINSVNDIRTITEGDTLQLSATVYPSGANQSVTWSSENSEVATIDENGLVTAVGAGNVSINAFSVANPEISASFALIVEEKEPEVILPTSVEIYSEGDVTTFKVGETLSLSAVVYPEGASQRVSWTSSDTEIATVSRGTVTALKEGNVTITVASDELNTITDTIELTIEKSDNPAITKDWSTVDFASHTTYMECEDDTPLKIKGVVTHVLPVDNNEVSYYIQNGTEGYYVYAQDALAFPVELGKSYEVGGFKGYYRGLRELKDVEYFVESKETFTYSVNDLAGKDPSSREEMSPYHCSFVTGQATINSTVTPGSSAYSIYVTVNGHETTLRVDPSNTGAEEFAEINEKMVLGYAGASLTFTGIMSEFGYGTPSTQIQIVDSDGIQFAELSDEDLLSALAPSLSIDTYLTTDETSIELPIALQANSDVSISWTSNDELINASTGAVTHPESDTTVKLTATLKLNDATEEVEFNVNVLGTAAADLETLVTFDLEDALAPNSWGNSESKSGYAAGTVELGTPVSTWLLDNALIASATNDRYDGILGIRAKAGGRVEIQEDGEYNVVQFDAAVYGNDATGIKVGVEYSLDQGATWTDSGTIFSIETKELETYKVSLPEGVKRVAIYIVAGSGNRVNLDNIYLMK